MKFSYGTKIALLALCASASAQTATPNATFTWAVPTTYEDGSAMAASDIRGYQINCRFIPKAGGADQPCVLSKNILAGGAVTSDTLTVTIPAAGGNACFRLSTLTNSSSAMSTNPSNEACKIFPPVAGAPPTNLRVVQVVVGVQYAPLYRAVTPTKLGTTLFGFIPAGRECKTFVARWRNRNWYLVDVQKSDLWYTDDVSNLAAPCA